MYICVYYTYEAEVRIVTCDLYVFTHTRIHIYARIYLSIYLSLIYHVVKDYSKLQSKELRFRLGGTKRLLDPKR